MNFLQICGVAVLGSVLALVLSMLGQGRQTLVLLGSALVLCVLLLPRVSGITAFLELPGLSGAGVPYEVLYKGVGLCLLTEIVGMICKTLGAQGVYSILELIGKAEILLLALPLARELLSLAEGLLS